MQAERGVGSCGAASYDERLGYSEVPEFVSALLARRYAIESEARWSRGLKQFVHVGGFPVYPEKDQAGLRIFDRNGERLYGVQFPERTYRRFSDIPELAVNRVQSKLRYSWLAFQLLPDVFTLPELRTVYAAILDPALLRLNTSNFKKAFAALFDSGALVPVGRRAAGGRPGRPGDLYRFEGPLAGTWARELPWHDSHDTGEAHAS